MNKKLFILIILTCLRTYSFAQNIISGKISNEDNTPVWGANIMLKQNNQSKIITFSRSDSIGKYVLTAPLYRGIFDIEVTSMEYKKAVQTIIVDDSTKHEIPLNFTLLTAQMELDEVVISSKPLPVIIKEDTIIYRVDSYKDAFDKSLEEVMLKFPGFRILPDGSIEVNGKTVNKVVIDGKEVSDLGTGILTKNIHPDMVENIEIRFDEKSEKLKESLLDDNKFVLLDIKLKSGVKKSLFGSVDANVGIKDKGTS